MAKVDWQQDNYEKSSGREALPKGRYLCTISDSEDKQTKDKTGRYFEFEFTVVKPAEFKNRKLWARLNVHNKSEVAERIGREQFNALADCVGMMGKVSKTEAMHDKMVVLMVTIKDGDKGDMNEVVGFQKYDGAQPQAKPAAAAPAASQAKPKPAAAGGTVVDDDDIPF